MKRSDRNFIQKVETGVSFQEITEWNFWRQNHTMKGNSNETGSRFVYGLGGRLYVDGSLLARATIGQSYMLESNNLPLPEESGMKNRRSYLVGSMELYPGNNASLTMRGRYNTKESRFATFESKLSFAVAGVSTTLEIFDIAQYNANPDYQKVKGGTVSLTGHFPYLSTWSWSGSGTVAGNKLRLLNRSIGVVYKGDVFSWTNTIAHTFQENYVKRYITTTYQDECFTMTIQAAHVFDDRFVRPKANQKDTQFTIEINFKNLGEVSSSRLEGWMEELERSRNEEGL
jgi:hypothetical protein